MSKTIIHKDNEAFFGEKKHLEASQRLTFPAMIFELLSEHKPSDAEIKVFELLLNLSIDHGPETPSALAVIEAAKAGKPMGESIAAGMAQINDSHGGAGQGCMEVLYKIKKESMAPADLVSEYLGATKRIPGYGHRIYKIDPRVELIFKTMRDAGLGEEYIGLAKELEKELKEKSGKELPVNIDGAIAVALCAFGWKPILAKAVFIAARAPGLCGQFLNLRSERVEPLPNT